MELNVPNALRKIYDTNSDALMFGTDLPSTRAKRPFGLSDIELMQQLFIEKEQDNNFYKNAQKWYFKLV